MVNNVRLTYSAGHSFEIPWYETITSCDNTIMFIIIYQTGENDE